MDKSEFLQKVAEILERPALAEGDALGPGAIDSLQLLSIISLIDESFGVTVPARELENAPTAGALWDVVQRAANP